MHLREQRLAEEGRKEGMFAGEGRKVASPKALSGTLAALFWRSGFRGVSRDRIPKGPFDLFFLFPEVEEEVLGEAYSVFFWQVYAAVVEHGLQFLDGRVGHPDHRFGFAQGLFALGGRKVRPALQPFLVLLEVLYEVPDAHGAGLYSGSRKA
jgi:hypothetical protein